MSDVIFDRRNVFHNTSNAWDIITPHWNRPLIDTNNTSTPKCIIPIANITKKAVLAVAYAVATIALGIFDILSLPYTYYKYTQANKNSYANEMKLLNVSESELVNIKKEISDYIRTLETSGEIQSIPSKKREAMISTIAASYARSKIVYGPIVRLWAEHLLEKAEKSGRKLIFMARDGIAPFHMAKKLMEKASYKERFPSLVGDDKIVLGYFSRKLIANANSSEENTQLLQKYLKNELGIQPGDRCLFVDVGFEGSMIDKIRQLAKPVIFSSAEEATPEKLEEALRFEFLISVRADRAEGFLATEHRKLQSVPSAGGNLGVHWLEDSHQGNLQSPTSLVEFEGRVYPNTKVPGREKQRVHKKGSFQHLLRKFSNRAIKACADLEIPSGKIKSENHREYDPSAVSFILFKSKATQLFDKTLGMIKSFELPLYLEH
ncbi:MAG: hypothetical protein NTX49_05890 [Chlamydiae bacterium]|nr:hypothetical protein [Chlamydiota bacterium]